MPLSSCWVGHLLLGMGPELKTICVPGKTPLERTEFSYNEWLSMNISFRLSMGSCVHVSSQCWDPVWHRLILATCILSYYLSSHGCPLYYVSLVASIPFGPCSLSVSSLWDSLINEQWYLTEKSHSGLNIPWFLTLCTMSSCECLVFFLIYCRMKLFR